jgi:1-deoxy-D-xylulose-5-phosphate reductoisomerase
MGKKITIDSATLMNKVFEIIEAKKIFELNYKDLIILVHEKSYVHAIVKFKNGLTKILIHDTDMKIPIFNSVYSDVVKELKTNNLNIEILNNLNFKYVDLKKFPVVKILKLLSNKNSLFETVIVSVNDSLVKLFLKKKISFLELNNYIIKFTNLTEFSKYKLYEPKNTSEIMALHDYVSLKIITYVYNK